MTQKKINANHRESLSPIKEHELANLWKRRGVEDVYYQREALVNLWTILGGIAVAALLTEVTNIIDEIQMGRWHLLLYFLTSITLIVNSWVVNVWGSLILRLQVTILHTFLFLINLICLAILCLQVTNPSIFFAVGGFFILFTLFIQVYTMKSGAWVVFTLERIKGIRTTLWIYVAFMILCWVAAANLFWIPSVAAEIGWVSFALLASVAAMVMQHFGMKQERKDLGIP